MNPETVIEYKTEINADAMIGVGHLRRQRVGVFVKTSISANYNYRALTTYIDKF